MVYGYVRVSAKDQNEDRQIIAMREVGVSEKNIYMDMLTHSIFRIFCYTSVTLIRERRWKEGKSG